MNSQWWYGTSPVLSPVMVRLVRWGPWLFWPMLVVTAGLLILRVAEGAGAGRVILAAAQVLVWVCLLLNHRYVWRRHRRALDEETAGPV
ncbi:hypothetical protein [Streptomyces zingiberis]|uniref:Uncharacterized protein n=1 Tax=Streptomyces zingiberis TaxID=2053010 RepID=A0ABX1BQ54_9ACTN|nr:hypothetical protein [Streptomyces zingiberis]NJP99864.1 hypothetical protein [Streptomyces zingiberis]